MHRFLLLPFSALVLLSLLQCAGKPAKMRPKSPRPIAVQGHRGARAIFPENTLPAFDYALFVGVDVLELDLQVTSDRILVVAHDSVLNADLCSTKEGGPIPQGFIIHRHPYAQLQLYDCGAKPNPAFPQQTAVANTPIPTLEQVIELVKKSPLPSAQKVRLNLEAKSVPGLPKHSPPAEDLAKLIVESLRAHNMVHRCNVQSFDHRVLIAVKQLEPDIQTAALTHKNLPDLVAVATAAKADIISPHHLWITKEGVKKLHQAGVRVVPWTVNSPLSWKRLLKLNVDGIITDDPLALIRYLQARGLRTIDTSRSKKPS